MTDQRTRISHGDATISYGKPFWGPPRIIANAHLTPQGFNDLTEALNQARDAYTAECERWLQAETQHHQEETL